MITGASQAEAAVLIIDVQQGVREQTKRHSYMLSILGIKQVIAVLNKMDLVDFSENHFNAVKTEVQEWLKSINIEPICYIPICAIKGDNITFTSGQMDWYSGPTFLESLDTLQNKQSPEDKPLLLPIQDVYKIKDRRISVGRVESGVITKGTKIKVLPSGQTTKVKSIEKFLSRPQKAIASESVGVTTADAVFLERGCILCLPGAEPVVTDTFNANIFWMSKLPLSIEQKLTIRCATQQTSCRIEKINRRIDSSTLEVIEQDAHVVENLEVAEVIVKTKKPIAIKDFNDVQELGRFVLVQDQNICAGGIISVAN
jgi:sulfate adenylyltransferase subunit 1 (EFTu-like GTPase family)